MQEKPLQNPYDIPDPEEKTAEVKAEVQDTVKGSSARFPFLTVLLVAVPVAVLVVVLVLSSGETNPLANTLSGNATLNGVLSTIAQKVNSTPKINVSYTGTETITIASGKDAGTSIKVLTTLEYQKYYNNSRITITARGVPLIGNVSVVEISLANKSLYTCGSFSVSDGFDCQPIASNISGIAKSYLALGDLPNSTSDSRGGVVIKKLGTSSYNGDPCYLVVINTTRPLNISSTNATFNAKACLSEQYYIPSNLSFSEQVATEGGSRTTVSVTLNQVSLNQQVVQSEVTDIPGPVNSSAFFDEMTHSSTDSLPKPVALQCSPSSGYGCQGAEMRSGLLTTYISQYSNSTFFNVGFACTVYGNGQQPTLPSTSEFQFPSTTGVLGPYNNANVTTLSRGQQMQINFLQCYGTQSLPTYNQSISGTIFINYTKSARPPGPSNPWITIDAAELNPQGS
jgi:hypothetical protein